jgi:hypothetical protein
MEDISKNNKSVNPVLAVVLAIIIALIISTINLALFIKSDMYEKVKLIQNPEQVLTDDSTLDTSSALNVENLNLLKKDIDTKFELLREDSDFSVYDISESTLGI